MKRWFDLKKNVICAMCIALCYVLPMVFHSIPNAGSVFCPMHIPVFICGLVAGWPYGLICGLVGPVLSSVLTGMPPMAILPSMMCELAVYGFVSGLMMKLVYTKSTYLDLYLSYFVAMILGRVVAGVTKAFLFTKGSYSMAAWVSGHIVTSLPGTVVQVVLLPSIVVVLMKSGLIEKRYAQKRKTEK